MTGQIISSSCIFQLLAEMLVMFIFHHAVNCCGWLSLHLPGLISMRRGADEATDLTLSLTDDIRVIFWPIRV